MQLVDGTEEETDKRGFTPQPLDSGPTASQSLGLRISDDEDVSDRLATIDGEPDVSARREETEVSERITVELDDQEEAPDAADQKPIYLLRREGTTTGPYSVYALGVMLGAGKIHKKDVLVHRKTKGEVRVGDVPALRHVAPQEVRPDPIETFARPQPQPIPSHDLRVPAPPRDESSRLPMIIGVAVALVAVMGGLILWLRST